MGKATMGAVAFGVALLLFGAIGGAGWLLLGPSGKKEGGPPDVQVRLADRQTKKDEKPSGQKEPPKKDQDDAEPAFEVGKSVTISGALVTGGGFGPEALDDPKPAKVSAGLDLRWRGRKVHAYFEDVKDVGTAENGKTVTVQGEFWFTDAGGVHLRKCRVTSVR